MDRKTEFKRKQLQLQLLLLKKRLISLRTRCSRATIVREVLHNWFVSSPCECFSVEFISNLDDNDADYLIEEDREHTRISTQAEFKSEEPVDFSGIDFDNLHISCKGEGN